MLRNGNYIQFYYSDGMEILGSDGVAYFDNRLSLNNLINYGERIIKSRQNIKPDIKEMIIYKKGRVIYNSKPELIKQDKRD